MKKYLQAEELALELHATRERTLGLSHTSTRSAIELLVTLYETWEKDDTEGGHGAAADSWRLRLTELSNTINQD